MRPPLKIVSGGQTGVDRAALDAAAKLGFPAGGWCPEGRRAEDGVISKKYPLSESPSEEYAQRTEWNIRDSDGTMILHMGKISGGTALTLALSRRYGRPFTLVDLSERADPETAARWIQDSKIATLNVAGPRESGEPGVYRRAYAFLIAVLRLLRVEQ